MMLSKSTHEETFNIHSSVNKAMLFAATKGRKLHRQVRQCWEDILDQLEPGIHIQYVNVEPSPAVEFLLQRGLLKETKKPGYNRFVVPKAMVYVTWEPTMPWLLSLTDEEREDYQHQREQGNIKLVEED